MNVLQFPNGNSILPELGAILWAILAWFRPVLIHGVGVSVQQQPIQQKSTYAGHRHLIVIASIGPLEQVADSFDYGVTDPIVARNSALYWSTDSMPFALI